MALVKIQKKGQVTLPTEVRRRLKLSDGDMVEVKISATSIIITPQVVIDRSKFPNADEYTPRQRRIIDARLDKAEEDIKNGRLYGPFATHEEFIASLHKEAKKLAGRKTKPKAK